MFGWQNTFEAPRITIPAIPLRAIKVEPISFATNERPHSDSTSLRLFVRPTQEST